MAHQVKGECKKKMLISLLLASCATSSVAVGANPFQVDESSSFQTAEHLGTHMVEKPKPEGRCGEGSCGSKMKKSEGRCGEGSCGSKMKKSEGRCGEGSCGSKMKKSEGRCGEGSCGSKMKKHK